MNRTTRGLAVALLIMFGIIGGGIAAVGSAEDHRQDYLSGVRAATARYHRLEAARADGYVNLDLCFDQMGEHYGQVASISDGQLVASQPEALVYAHDGDRLKLVAVEYVSTTAGSVLGMPLHYNPTVQLWVLHAWVFKHNPDGMHEDLNPRVGDCP